MGAGCWAADCHELCRAETISKPGCKSRQATSDWIKKWQRTGMPHMWVSGRHQSRLQTPEALSARYLRLGNTLPQRKCTLHNAAPSPPQSSPWPSGSRS